jgi:hypothetical protein
VDLSDFFGARSVLAGYIEGLTADTSAEDRKRVVPGWFAAGLLKHRVKEMAILVNIFAWVVLEVVGGEDCGVDE